MSINRKPVKRRLIMEEYRDFDGTILGCILTLLGCGIAALLITFIFISVFTWIN